MDDTTRLEGVIATLELGAMWFEKGHEGYVLVTEMAGSYLETREYDTAREAIDDALNESGLYK